MSENFDLFYANGQASGSVGSATNEMVLALERIIEADIWREFDHPTRGRQRYDTFGQYCAEFLRVDPAAIESMLQRSNYKAAAHDIRALLREGASDPIPTAPEPKRKPRSTRNTTTTNYRAASAAFWPTGDVDYAYDAFDTINRIIYGGELPAMPIMYELQPHGKRLGYCAHGEPPRISLHPSLLRPKSARPWSWDRDKWNAATLADVLTHEMVHAALFVRGEKPDHNASPWAAEVVRQSPIVGLGSIVASPWKRARKPDGGLTYKPTTPGSIPRATMATWPYSCRPDDYYDDPRPWFDR